MYTFNLKNCFINVYFSYIVCNNLYLDMLLEVLKLHNVKRQCASMHEGSNNDAIGRAIDIVGKQ